MPIVKGKGRPAAAPLRHRFGAHLSIAGGVHHALEAAHALRCETVQVFVKNQRQWRAAPLQPADLARWHGLLTKNGFGPVIAHATYLINLASSDPALHARSRAAFADELLRCDALNIPYLVVHPGSAGAASPEHALARVAAALNRIFELHPDLRAMPLLETTAGQGTALGRTFEELAAIITRVHEPHRVAVCIDTCHVFAAGYDLRQPDVYAAMIATAARTIGLDRIRCWHLNDCPGACGAHVDRHEHIGRGQLGTAAFRNVLGDRRFVGVPMILETPKGANANGQDLDRVNLRRLRTIATRALTAATQQL